jgi:hypothetical protein
MNLEINPQIIDNLRWESMNTKHGRMFNVKPVSVFFVRLSVAILLVTILSGCSSSPLPDNALAYLSAISGDVKVSDGIAEAKAQEGVIESSDGRTILKTGEGKASLMIRNGSHVILDMNSTIELNRDYMKDPGKPFAFNLAKGRVIVINGQDSQKPTQVFVGSNITARVFQAAMGLEVQVDGDVHERVDCLVGPCVVNGDYYLVSGQSASMSQDGAVQVVAEFSRDVWLSLGQVDPSNPNLSNLVAMMQPTSVPTINPISPTDQITTILQISSSGTSTPSPTSTLTNIPTETPTHTPTITMTPTATPTLVRFTYVPPTITPSPEPPERSKPKPPAPPAPTDAPEPTDEPPPPPTNEPPPPPRDTEPPPPPPTDRPAPTEPPLPN